MIYVVTFSNAAINTQLQNLGHSMREWEMNDRTGFLLPFKLATEEDLAGCDWGRQPKGKGKGGATLGNFMPAQLGLAASAGLGQQQDAQLGQQQGANMGQQQGAQLGRQQQGTNMGQQGAQLGQSKAPAFGTAQWAAQSSAQSSTGQQSGVQQQFGQQAGTVADAWQGQSLGSSPNPGQQLDRDSGSGNTGWDNYNRPQPPGSMQAGSSSQPTYANIPVTGIASGGSCTVTNPDGSPWQQSEQPQAS